MFLAFLGIWGRDDGISNSFIPYMTGTGKFPPKITTCKNISRPSTVVHTCSTSYSLRYKDGFSPGVWDHLDNTGRTCLKKPAREATSTAIRKPASFRLPAWAGRKSPVRLQATIGDACFLWAANMGRQDQTNNTQPCAPAESWCSHAG